MNDTTKHYSISNFIVYYTEYLYHLTRLENHVLQNQELK